MLLSSLLCRIVNLTQSNTHFNFYMNLWTGNWLFQFHLHSFVENCCILKNRIYDLFAQPHTHSSLFTMVISNFFFSHFKSDKQKNSNILYGQFMFKFMFRTFDNFSNLMHYFIGIWDTYFKIIRSLFKL